MPSSVHDARVLPEGLGMNIAPVSRPVPQPNPGNGGGVVPPWLVDLPRILPIQPFQLVADPNKPRVLA